jgi:hypothetical protein
MWYAVAETSWAGAAATADDSNRARTRACEREEKLGRHSRGGVVGD